MAASKPSRASASSTVLLRHASDERLARLAGRGNQRAFAALYERYHQPLYRLCLSIVRTPEDAHDALQSTFERALGALGGGERTVSVRPWLFRIAHNESISVLRRRRPEGAVEEDELVSPRTVEGAAEDRARLSELVADIDSLPARQRSALLMRELSGLSIAEIAVALSMSTGAVKQALFEARTSLHEFAEGRAMACNDVRRTISDGDRRALRTRRVRAHLRDCAGCAAFNTQISHREADLRALAPPLPAAAAAAMLGRLLSHGAGAHAGAAAGAPALVAAKGGASSLALKGVTGLALAAALGAGATQLASHTASSHRPAAHTHALGTEAHGARHAGASSHAGTAARSAHAHAPGTHAQSARGVTGASRSLGPAPGSNGLAAPGRASNHGVRAHGSPSKSHPTLHGKRSRGNPQAAKPTPPPAHTKPAEPKRAEPPAHTHAPSAAAPAEPAHSKVATPESAPQAASHPSTSGT